MVALGSFRDRHVIPTQELPRLNGRPERIFVSVDESIGRATLSFAPGDVGAPILIEDDPRGEQGLAKARAIADAFPGAQVVGPHFHTAATRPRSPRGRR